MDGGNIEKKWDLENKLFRPGVNLGLQGLGLDKGSVNLGSKLDNLSPGPPRPIDKSTSKSIMR